MERQPTRILTTLAVSMLALTLIAPWVLGQDPDAITEIRHQAEQGDVDAQFTLGTIYSIGQIMFANGVRVGPESDAAEAAKWFRLAAEQDHATAQNNLGGMYADGRGVPQDDAEAVRWYRQAAEQREAEAQNNLGLMYDNGRGVPVDVITTQDFISQGDVDLTNQLRNVVPSFNVNTQPISDAATVVRPANLRNMAPDHTLVLVNGKRRHRAAVIAWLGNGVADGAQGPDLSVIPPIALRQVEVLRDGAAAQYGSDAIAGVMNFVLKNARSGGSLEFRTGRRYDENDGNPSTCGPLAGRATGSAGTARGMRLPATSGCRSVQRGS